MSMLQKRVEHRGKESRYFINSTKAHANKDVQLRHSEDRMEPLRKNFSFPNKNFHATDTLECGNSLLNNRINYKV